jgi:hypothetical protein
LLSTRTLRDLVQDGARLLRTATKTIIAATAIATAAQQK